MTINRFDSNSCDLRVAINQFDSVFLKNLELFQELGLLSEAQLREFCAQSLCCPIVASLPVQSSHPNVLLGLEPLLAQGVLSHEQVLSWCQSNLSKPLPAVAMVAASPVQEDAPPAIKAEPKVGWVPSMLQSLMDEISVLWLLFLGVFLVVVSSAVLAASQWNSVPAVGQYGILWAYTLAFWGVSHWLGRRDRLQLTAHTLQLTALLIIPVNFWMIDSFRLVQGGVSFLLALGAGLVLSGLASYTLNPRSTERWGRYGWVMWINVLLLSWLHWGWQMPGVPPIAIYVGIIVTGVCTVWANSEVLETVRARPPTVESFDSLFKLMPLYGMVLLLFRGIWIVQVPLSSLGLAFGVMGAIFCWTGRRPGFGSQSWWFSGLGCLIFGRCLIFGDYGQSILVTGLVLWVLLDRLFGSWRPWLVWLIFFAGLQGLYPLYGLVPVPVQQSFVMWVESFTGPSYQPALLSLLVMPYWCCMIWAMDFLRQRVGQGPSQLAPLLERMALGLGGFLTLLTLGDSCLRMIFLVGVGVMLGLRRRPSARVVALLHSVVLGAIASGVDYFFPTLAVERWAMVCLLAMMGELIVSVYGPLRWRVSAWWAALILAGAGYLCLSVNRPDWVGLDEWPGLTPDLRLPPEAIAAWLIPLGFTGVSYVRSFAQRVLAQRLGLGSIFAVQFLCLPDTSLRLVGFVLALGLTWALSVVMRRFFPVGVTIGWGVALAIDSFYSYIPPERQDWFWVVWALLCLSLAVFSVQVRRLDSELAMMYGRAAMGWSYWLTATLTGVLLLVAIVLILIPGAVLLPLQLGAVGAALAALYQFGIRLRPACLYLSAIAIEVSILLLAWLAPWPQDVMAMGTLMAGGLTVFLARYYPQIAQRHWTILPLMFASGGLLLGHYDFLAHTGVYTLGVSLILLLLGRREGLSRGITYLGIAAFSFGLYELLVYQILQAEGEHPGDALVIFAGVATGLAIADRLFTRGLTRMLRLSPMQFLPVAHLHWLAASLFLLTALVTPMRVWAEIAWVGLLLILFAYAMVAGRLQSGFLYAGVAQGLGAIAFGMAQVMPLSVLGHWGGAIAVGAAAFLYYFPWARYAWEVIPEQRMAMILPVGVVALSLPTVGLTSVLCAGAWYFWISQRPNLLRLSYLGLVFGNWAIFRLLERWDAFNSMWMVLMLGCSALLVVQWEPLLQSPERREVRHWLRCLALGLMSLVALYESDGYFGWSLVVVLAGLLLGVAGLILRTRAFLYVGTGLFGVKVFWLLWAFVSDYSLLLWALGIVLGIALIWVAATFESRRSQAIAFLDYWVNALQRWQ